MTDKQTPPDWVLIEAAKRCGWVGEAVEVLRTDYHSNTLFRALCDMIEKHEQPPVDRKLLCAREAARQYAISGAVEHVCARAIELWEEGFGE